jgi:hypothetical protein
LGALGQDIVANMVSESEVSNLNPIGRDLLKISCIGLYQGYIPNVHDQDYSADPCRGHHRPTLQQDGGKITPRDRILVE